MVVILVPFFFLRQALHKQFLCEPCDPYQAHLYAKFDPEVQLCKDFCLEYVKECGLPADFCAGRTSDDEHYCLPCGVCADFHNSNSLDDGIIINILLVLFFWFGYR